MANERSHASFLFDNKRRPSTLLTQWITNACCQIGQRRKNESEIQPDNRPPHHLFTNSRTAEKWRRNNCSDRQYISRRANVIDKERVAYRVPFLFPFKSCAYSHFHHGRIFVPARCSLHLSRRIHEILFIFESAFSPHHSHFLQLHSTTYLKRLCIVLYLSITNVNVCEYFVSFCTCHLINAQLATMYWPNERTNGQKWQIMNIRMCDITICTYYIHLTSVKTCSVCT